MSAVIRKMTEADLDEIVLLEQECFTSPWPKKEFLYELNENPFAQALVLEEDGRIVGYCDCWIIFERAELANIAVRRECRRSGHAQQMLDYLFKTANEAGCDFMTLEVRVSNTPAIRLYERNGFIQVNIRKNYYTDNNEDAYLMVKPLGGIDNDITDGN